VIGVDDVIPCLQVSISRFGGLRNRPLAMARLRTTPTENLSIGEQVQEGPVWWLINPAFCQAALDETEINI